MRRSSDIYQRLAAVEDRHVEIWGELLTQHGRPPGPFRPAARTRLLAFLGERFGPGFLLPMLLAEEGREVKGYLDMHRAHAARASPGDERGAHCSRARARSMRRTLGRSPGAAGEPWHRTERGRLPAQRGLRLQRRAHGELRARGRRDRRHRGGAAHHAVIVAGVAGLIADALSMGSSGYLAAKSEQEVYAHEIAMERDEIALMPEVERDELALIYEAKGMDRDAAHALATEVMADPERMLEEQVQEELEIGDAAHVAAARGVDHGTRDGGRRAHPGVPVLRPHRHDGDRRCRSRSRWRPTSSWARRARCSPGAASSAPGFDMFVVGLGVAVVGYYVGEWIARLL